VHASSAAALPGDAGAAEWQMHSTGCAGVCGCAALVQAIRLSPLHCEGAANKLKCLDGIMPLAAVYCTGSRTPG